MKIHRCEMEEIVYCGEPALRKGAKEHLKMLKKHLTIGRETLPKDESDLVSGIPYRDPLHAPFFFSNAKTVAEIVRGKVPMKDFKRVYQKGYRIVEEDMTKYILWVNKDGVLYVSTSVYTMRDILKRKRYREKPIPDPYAEELLSCKLLLFGEKGFWGSRFN